MEPRQDRAMRNLVVSVMLAVCLVALPLASLAQQSPDVFRLPPSVGATPIEIPGTGRQAATPIEIPGAGRQAATPIEIPGAGRHAATPIEIPGKTRGDLMAALPRPITGARVEAFDPRRNPEAFSALPLPIPDPRSIEKMGEFIYVLLPDGTIYGDTNFGYARFDTLDTYERFLQGH